MKKKKDNKKWHGWFRPSGRPVRQGPLVVSEAEILREDVPTRIISVPRNCGTAAYRNRFRRVLKEELKEKWLEKSLWIRLRKDYRLNHKITQKEWAPKIEKALRELFS